MKNDDFGDRMKGYELAFRTFIADQAALPYYPYMRLDGRSFSNFTKKLASRGLLKKPRDEKFEFVFVRAVQDTVKEFNILTAFHQSDEISLFFKPVTDPISEPLFNGNIEKLCSVVASYFTARFCFHFSESYGEVPECSFDGRVCAFPSDAEATNMLVWRYQDASRNAIQDHAHFKFGSKKLFGVSTQEKWEMLGCPDLKAGNFVKRVKFQFDTPYVDKFTMQQTVTRSRIDVLRNLDFQNMTFEERVNLIYGEMNV